MKTTKPNQNLNKMFANAIDRNALAKALKDPQVLKILAKIK